MKSGFGRSRWRGGRYRVLDLQRTGAAYVEINYGSQEVPVTHLRKMMLEELQRRHYSHRTAKTYTRIVRDFAQHFDSSPNQLSPEQIRQYQDVSPIDNPWQLPRVVK